VEIAYHFELRDGTLYAATEGFGYGVKIGRPPFASDPG
jgi:hypothetical protein